MLTRRTLLQRLLCAAAGTVLAKMPLVGPKVEAIELAQWQHDAYEQLVTAMDNYLWRIPNNDWDGIRYWTAPADRSS